MEWYEIVSIVIGVAGALLGIAFTTKFQKVIKLIRELGELLTVSGALLEKTAEALKDRKVTKAEAVLLLKGWQDACAEFVDVYAVLKELIPAGIIKFLFRR